VLPLLLAQYALCALATAQIPLPKLPKLPPLRPPTPAPQPATAPAFAGRYAGGEVSLELDWDAATRRYRGTLTVAGEAMPCEASEQADQLVGAATTDGERLAFTLAARGAEYVFTCAGEQRVLARHGGATVDEPAHGQAPAGAVPGGVGVGLQLDAQGRFVITQLAPGGPAECNKVPLGGVLRAVDGRPVAGLTMDQVRGLIVGPVGSEVTLTIETEGGSAGFVLVRAPLGGPSPVPYAPGGNPPEQPGAPVPPPPPGAAIGAYPAWMQPGVRITYYSGSATLPGVRTQLVESPDGGWVDGAGRRYRAEDVQGTGGAGYTQFDLVQVDPACLGASMTMFVFADAQLATVSRTGAQGLTGDAGGMSDIWLPPARLRALQEQRGQGVTVLRGRYPLGGQTYDAVSTQTRTQSGYTRYTYDLDTGLLLAYSSSSTGGNVMTPVGDRGAVGEGSTMIVAVQLRNVRQLRLPWHGQRPPQRLQPGAVLHFAGTYRNSLAEGLPPWRFDARVALQQRLGDCLVARLTTHLDYGNGMGQDGDSLQVYGPASTIGLCLDAARLVRLQPEQVLDRDPLTGWEICYVGSDGRHATILERGPLEQQTSTYDLATGTLVATSMRNQVGPATIAIDLELQPR
jgi:hypothetical protein